MSGALDRKERPTGRPLSRSLLLATAAALTGVAGCAQGAAPIRQAGSAPGVSTAGSGPRTAPPTLPAPAPAPASDLPEWLRLRLAGYDAQPAASAPQAVYRMTYGAGVAFYLRSGCCDQPDPLLDADGVVVCHPSGGITGRGDGKCPGPLPPAAQWREVWRHR